MTRKISRVTGTPAHPIEHSFEYTNTYAREALGGSERLRVGLRGGQAHLFRLLGAALAPPYRVLYVLHTSRTGAPLGRYESPDLDGPEVEALERRFGAYFAGDARHDVWLHSLPDCATLVLDRYNLVHAYGPLDALERQLRGAGVAPAAAWAAPEVPSPHALHDHPEWDAAERALLAALAWHRKLLRPEDVQAWTGPQPA